MKDGKRAIGIALRVVIPIVIVSVAAMGFSRMKSMKKQPKTGARKEPVRQVTTMTLELADQTVYLSGYAYVGSQTRIPISSEVGGKVVMIKDSLESGALVSKGSVLWKVDDRDIRNTVAIQESEKVRLAVEIKRLGVEKTNLEATLKLRERATDLNKVELKRMQSLLNSGGSVSQATVESSEQRVIASKESVLSLRQQLKILPIRKESLEASLKKVDAQLRQNALMLSRCTVVAPITGRLKDVAVELGQTVQPSQPLAYHVDDNDLAAQVDLPASDVVKWLPITATAESNWLGPESPITAQITWVDDPLKKPVKGILQRISGVDGTTRSATLVFSIQNQKPRRLFEGMFCRISVKGKRLAGVFRIPRRAMTVDGRIPTIVDGRLLSKSAKIIVHQGEDVIIASSGTTTSLQTGDVVITSPVQTLPDGHLVTTPTKE
jgi:multidrug efflux pump subunit AcrA (membrane-fusion protein)